MARKYDNQRLSQRVSTSASSRMSPSSSPLLQLRPFAAIDSSKTPASQVEPQTPHPSTIEILARASMASPSLQPYRGHESAQASQPSAQALFIRQQRGISPTITASMQTSRSIVWANLLRQFLAYMTPSTRTSVPKKSTTSSTKTLKRSVSTI